MTELRYLGALENVFTYEGQPGHEIVLVHRIELADDVRLEGDREPYTARWLPRDDDGTGLDPQSIPDRLASCVV